MIITITGHRPKGLNEKYGYDLNNYAWTELKNKMKQCVKACYELYAQENESLTLITGMALGVDQAFWQAANELRKEYEFIKIEAAVPCKNQESKWFPDSQKLYREMLEKSDKVTYVSKNTYTRYCMEKRNEYMVDKSDIIIAIINKTTGGTARCVEYAKKQNKSIIIIKP